MPHLEAPSSITTDSSTERSLSPEILRSPVREFELLVIPNSPQHRDDPEYQLPVEVPPAVHLLPVMQEVDITMDVLLQRVTGRSNLENIEAVHLRVISYRVSLNQLALFLPRLLHLDLSGSVLNSLRDLGLGLVHLSSLNVSNCGLSSLDGITGTPSIRVLIGSDNMIQRVDPLVHLPLLQKLSLLNNCIGDLGLLTFLGMCTNLTELNLQGNPVCHTIRYRLTLQQCVPPLQLLDGEPIIPDAVIPAPQSSDSSSIEGDFSSLSSGSLTSSEHASISGKLAIDSDSLPMTENGLSYWARQHRTSM